MKPLIAWMQPSAGYSIPYKKAAKAFYRPTARGMDRIELEQGTSSTPRTFNMLLCDALNLRPKHKITHLAMIHDDVGPDGHCLDVLMDELDSTGAFMVSAVIPIKNDHALTSTAVDIGDPWVVRRLTMREVFQLPETFDGSEIPWNTHRGQLLVNTGLWLARFDPQIWEAFAESGRATTDGQSGFRFINRIAKCPITGEYRSEDCAEDWDMAKQLSGMGCKLMATRKVQLEHGHPRYHNRHPWGDWPTDLAYLQCKHNTHAPADPGDMGKFPADVDGWLSEVEGVALANLARGKRVLEIGAYCGKSTICLAQTAEFVYVVDPFDGRATTEPRDTLATFIENLIRYRVIAKCTTKQGISSMIVPDLEREYDLAFIDAAHDRYSVLEDAQLAQAKLKPGGLLAFHDYGRPGDEGVTAAVETLLSRGAEIVSLHDTIVTIRPPVAA